MSKLKTAASSASPPRRSALEHLPRGLPGLFNPIRHAHAAAHVEQQRHAHRRIGVGAELDDVAALARLLDDEVLLLEVGGEPAVLVAHDRGDRHDVDRRSEGGFAPVWVTASWVDASSGAHTSASIRAAFTAGRLIVTPPYSPRSPAMRANLLTGL